MSADSVPTLDRSFLLEMLDGDEEIAQEIMDLYLDEIPTMVAVIRHAVGDGDAEAIRRGAHTLKGASANVGATAMRELCSRIEQAGAAGDVGTATQLFGRMDVESLRLIAAARGVFQAA